MRQEFAHEPVMVGEIVDLFAPVPAGVVLDGTVGGGGHAAALLEAYGHLRVVGIDRDPDAVAAAAARLARFGPRALVRQARFDRFPVVLEEIGVPAGSLSGVLLDLGVSSPQFDRPARGFSYRVDAPLDMRMDPSAGPTAAELLASMSEADLAALLAANGEGRFARRIARAVLEARPATTGELAAAVGSALPAAVRRRRGHPARRVFQALRIAVNDELAVLARTLPLAIEAVAPGGRIVVIAYHSGEDRLVKAAFATAVSGGCTCPPGLPCACGAVALGRLIVRGARRPSPLEVARNRRAQSARLRALERLAPGGAA